MSKAYAHYDSSVVRFPLARRVELACRTDSLAALRAAVDHGAHSIRLKWRMRQEMASAGYPEFQRAGLRKAVQYAHEHGCAVSLELAPGCNEPVVARTLLARALEAGIEDIALSSQSLALYLRIHHPSIGLRLIAGEELLSVRALALLNVQLGIRRVTLPPVVSLAQVAELGRIRGMELEVQATGAGCALIAGSLPASRPNLAAAPGDGCSDGSLACNDSTFLCASPDPTQVLSQLPALLKSGARGILIETSGRSPARMAQLTHDWRRALDRLCPSATTAGKKGTASDAA